MAVFYVTTSGSASNPGTVSSPWSLAKAISTAGAGDTVYIAPGVYSGTFTLTNSGTVGNRICFFGDPKLTQPWSGISPGLILFTNLVSENSNSVISQNSFTATSKSNINWQDIWFENYGGSMFRLTTCTEMSWNRCAFSQYYFSGEAISNTVTAGIAQSFNINKCLTFNSSLLGLQAQSHTAAYDLDTQITNCQVINGTLVRMDTNNAGGQTNAGNMLINNCFVVGNGVQVYRSTTALPVKCYNTLLISPNLTFNAGVDGAAIEDYNRAFGTRYNTAVGNNTIQAGRHGFEFGQSLLMGLPSPQLFSALSGFPMAGVGTTGSPATTDIYGNSWSTTRPDIGVSTYKNLTSISGVIISEPNKSNINITAGSTSQSINFMLSGSGISYNASELQVFYTRQNFAPVGIGLTWQTPTGIWKSGGFIEVNSSSTPGLYRLDIPNAALSSGSSSVVISIRGSSFNSTSITVNLTPIQAQLDTTQDIGTTTVGDALNAANAGGIGKWNLSGDLLSLYAADGTLVKKLRVKSLRLDV